MKVRALKAKSKATKENVEVPMRGADPAAASAASPFAAISATMGWDTLHLVQSLWLSTIDLPPSSKEKNWELQVRCTQEEGAVLRLNGSAYIKLQAHLS